jgi:glycine dehydrogenase subunit 1
MRYLPLTDSDRQLMLQKIGVRSIDELFKDVPKSAWLNEPIDLPRHMGELEVERDLGKLAAKNVSASSVPFFVGAGAYKHTPYQPEIAQGTLQYLFEFQTQVALITGMEVANASMYDGSTGAGEAVLMAGRVAQRNKAIVSGHVHPQYRCHRDGWRCGGPNDPAPTARSCGH